MPVVFQCTAKAGLEETMSRSDLMEEPIVGSKVEIIDAEAPANVTERRRPPGGARAEIYAIYRS